MRAGKSVGGAARGACRTAHAAPQQPSLCSKPPLRRLTGVLRRARLPRLGCSQLPLEARNLGQPVGFADNPGPAAILQQLRRLALMLEQGVLRVLRGRGEGRWQEKGLQAVRQRQLARTRASKQSTRRAAMRWGQAEGAGSQLAPTRERMMATISPPSGDRSSTSRRMQSMPCSRWGQCRGMARAPRVVAWACSRCPAASTLAAASGPASTCQRALPALGQTSTTAAANLHIAARQVAHSEHLGRRGQAQQHEHGARDAAQLPAARAGPRGSACVTCARQLRPGDMCSNSTAAQQDQPRSLGVLHHAAEGIVSCAARQEGIGEGAQIGGCGSGLGWEACRSPARWGSGGGLSTASRCLPSNRAQQVSSGAPQVPRTTGLERRLVLLAVVVGIHLADLPVLLRQVARAGVGRGRGADVQCWVPTRELLAPHTPSAPLSETGCPGRPQRRRSGPPAGCSWRQHASCSGQRNRAAAVAAAGRRRGRHWQLGPAALLPAVHPGPSHFPELTKRAPEGLQATGARHELRSTRT